MNREKFRLLWESKFPNSYPIGYELKWIFNDRWFRIHSLPRSKRYADTEDEYQIIFRRQNEIITELTGEKEEVIFLFGLVRGDLTSDNYNKIEEFDEAEKVDTLALHEIRPEETEDERYYDIYVKKIIWKSNQRNEILRAIADDEIRMMIIFPGKNRIIYLYDGGADLILESKVVCDKYKEKYKMWLSKHPQGL